jgi:hypothetical protein
MTSIPWSLLAFASELLEPEERDAVLGDLSEAGDSVWRGLLDVFGLVVRRQAGLWSYWRPWLAAFGLALPGSFLLMGFSVSVSRTCRQLLETSLPQANELAHGLLPWTCLVLLLTGCAWSGGFVAGSISRRTLWVTIAATCSPCLFCLTRFRIESLPPLCLLLFLLPAIVGVRQGLRTAEIAPSRACVLAVVITLLMILTQSRTAASYLNWVLVWPAWYMVATARKPGTDLSPRNTAEQERPA